MLYELGPGRVLQGLAAQCVSRDAATTTCVVSSPHASHVAVLTSGNTACRSVGTTDDVRQIVRGSQGSA